jgi:Na+/phosphate symporter
MNERTSYRDWGQLSLWFSFLGGGVAWLLHLTSAWAISEFGCFGGLYRWTWLDLTAIAWLIILATIITSSIAVAATCVGYRTVRRVATDSVAVDPSGTASFLAYSGLITSGFFVFVILVESVPLLFFRKSC